jgi:hypothetical protein
MTHRPHETVVKGDTTIEFVTRGIEAALAQAREAAGAKNVIVMGGADLLRQYLAAGVVDADGRADPARLGQAALRRDRPHRHHVRADRRHRVTLRDAPALPGSRRQSEFVEGDALTAVVSVRDDPGASPTVARFAARARHTSS